jgi:hypothetical protein
VNKKYKKYPVKCWHCNEWSWYGGEAGCATESCDNHKKAQQEERGQGQLQQAAAVQSAADSMSSSHAGAAWPPVPPPEGVWRQFLALQQAQQLQHMQHKQLQQQQQIDELLQQQRWEQQQQYTPLMRAPGMPEWDKTKAPWNARMGQVGQEQGSSSSGQQLLPATAPNMEQATEAATAPGVISRLLLQENMTCFSTLSSPTLQAAQQLKQTVTE